MTSKPDPVFSVTSTVPIRLAAAINAHGPLVAFRDDATSMTYAALAVCIDRISALLPVTKPVAVYGTPSVVFGAATTACVVLGRPFVHLDPAMPVSVLENILNALEIDTVLTCQTPKAGQLDNGPTLIDVVPLCTNDSRAVPTVEAGNVAADDAIYIVATSGTTGKPKCIPVTHQSAHLSYEWRDTYTPYAPGYVVGAYIFSIWEHFRPLRDGATVCFPSFKTLMTPKDLAGFLRDARIDEMLFTPSALEKSLQSLGAADLADVPLSRIILNGEVVSDDLIAAVQEKLPHATLWNLYSICETHDVSMTEISQTQKTGTAVSVGVPMPFLKAVVLDDFDQPCPQGTPGLLYFEGPQMLGPGYVNRPEDTALRFRTLTIEGRKARLYDTGDQAYIAADGAIHITGRIAHMLKLRGHSIQTREMTATMQDHMQFLQAIPWVQGKAGERQTLVLYYKASDAQVETNRAAWGLEPGERKIPAALSQALSAVLPGYCIPSYLVGLNEIPINAVSGKCDYRALPPIRERAAVSDAGSDALPTLIHAAAVIDCDLADLSAARSFHDQGGDSLMAVNFLLALEAAYQTHVDFDLALTVPLGRLHALLSEAKARPKAVGGFDRPGILLTGATGFLGSRVMAAAITSLPQDHVIYCVVRPKRRDPLERLQAIARENGVPTDRIVLVPAAIEDAQFGLLLDDYTALGAHVTSVVHCAAMVNLAVDRAHMENWSQAGIANILTFCRDAHADLRFSSSTAVFPEQGGPFPETETEVFSGCSGYGAAKIAAEKQIIASGVPAAIVRLPSLYDLTRPNTKDIYETIMTACANLGAVPEGLTFRMINVAAAARFLVEVAVSDRARIYNMTPDTLVDLDCGILPALPVRHWIDTAPLSEAERTLIRADTRVLKADVTMVHDAASAMWQKIAGQSLESITNPQAVCRARLLRQAAAAE
ncbi:Acyl-CoA synthetase (AMP-forming)/AMP-acid ligase II [Cognatiyoonia koreensis]|uniref:Acyl-CoA synthetase (AMP-forming)/AMP-acid ligase II n=1 Tax=Cognatiyoonia koreensis TaxID=364200 RepID=A0A1I0MRM5_9RHOB|nr:AMP-binding protein [Cognatiyoonia koreensis]SEV91340.1 Acyl-CoA synthetase (AMP-forming)/AMP-acid ligase II [Cognatiyoonia koreensis]